jgi:hypothetical protein
MYNLTTSQKETLDLFSSGAVKLEKLVSGLNDQELDLSLSPGEWSIRQIIHHVAEDGDIWAMHFKRAIAANSCKIRFEEFPGNEDWAKALAFEKRPVSTSLSLIKIHRQSVAELAEFFKDKWQNSIVVIDTQGKELQKISAGQIVSMLAGHLSEHVSTIEAIQRKHGISGRDN